MSHHASAGERIFIEAPMQHAWTVPLVPTALKTTACDLRKFMPSQDTGDQLLIMTNSLRVARKPKKEVIVAAQMVASI